MPAFKYENHVGDFCHNHHQIGCGDDGAHVNKRPAASKYRKLIGDDKRKLVALISSAGGRRQQSAYHVELANGDNLDNAIFRVSHL